ncbi:glycosyl hydrolase 115 family protein [Novosphingobium pokkalii]|uniref:Glycosyl hydrolase 115 family protein n=1 Tax=Novosphingobium pokkalii TaxID=1770194 RepID=A0ABV7V2G0_9SPHN|nr:glycosyl hydrolase 115 family protein [Novosphingobium pokkalii]GHC89664.1 hypothetical protein GCM10019060_13380 [Novosphingobium pokkalii]
MKPALPLPLRKAWILAIAALLASPAMARDEAVPLVHDTGQPGALLLAGEGHALPILTDPHDAEVVRRAAADLAQDIATVSGVKPVVRSGGPRGGNAVVIGTLGHNRAIDGLVARGRLSVSGLAGAWESFVIATVDRPWPGVDQALVIVGSDRRGTAYGAYELARAIGVSPWAWWADLPPRHRDALWLDAGLHRFGPPSVKYRGIFLNDEDWGLYPWAAQTYDPAYGNIGPRTYQRVFELMLRLKANTLWPAMHKTTRAFNADPANARLADSYGIVMGSSHAEAMLRNNVGEWKDDPARFNYATNRAGVRAYWDERARINAGYESLWTVGLRGLHDTGMVGAPTMAARQALLDQAIADQRAILDAHVPGGAARAGQIFVPYKEVLDIYRAGIHVPDNVTIVWPDDNFGYIRQFPSPAEAARSGGAGVYYHLSYLGYPLAYLWLYTTPPALVQEEMLRAYDAGARQLWMVNVGDIKPAEIGISHFLDLAWDVERWRGTSQHAYLAQWLGAAFGPQAGEAGADLLDAHFRLNMVRRPDHLEWPAHEEDRHLSSLTPAQVDARLGEMRRIAAHAEQVGQGLPADRRDAWFELVGFPLGAAAAANVRFFAAERFDEQVEVDPAAARSAEGAVAQAEADIAALTQRYNTGIAGGKWRGIMPAEPADSQWRIYRPRPVVTPAPLLRSSPQAFFQRVDSAPPARPDGLAPPREAAGWRWIDGIGPRGGALMAQAPGATMAFTLDRTAPGAAALDILPLFAQGDARSLHLAVALDDGPPQDIVVPRQVGDAAWVAGVLDNRLRLPLPFVLPAGHHRLRVVAQGSGIGVIALVDTSQP